MEKEKRLKQMREYQKNNKEKISKRKKQKYLENKESALKYQKEYYEKNKKSISKKDKERYASIPKDYQTNKKLDLTIEEKKERKSTRRKARNIPLKSSCQICGDKQNLERHHWRYDKPLMVATLCKDCHAIQHVKNFSTSKYGGNNFGK